MPMRDENDIRRRFERLASVQPSEESARRAIDRTRRAIDSHEFTDLPGKRRAIMLTRIAALVLLLLFVTSAVGGVVWYVASNTSDEPQQESPSEIVTPAQPQKAEEQNSPKAVEEEIPDSDPKKTPTKDGDEVEPSEPTPEPKIVKDNDPPSESDSTNPAVVSDMDPNWGHLTGTFVFDGDTPPTNRLRASKDIAFCGKHKLVDESLIVNKQNKGIKNIVVFLYVNSSEDPPTPHPSYEKTALNEVVVNNSRCRFDPHIVLVRTNQPLVIKNSDKIGHNAKLDFFNNRPINPLIPPYKDSKHVFTTTERLPARLSCTIHPWMAGWVVVKDHPYMAVTDENGRFQIDNLPVGEWTFQFWHEKAGYVRDVTIDESEVSWSRGRVTLNIGSGHNDLGTVSTTITDD